VPSFLLAAQSISPVGSIVVGLLLVVLAPLLYMRILPFIHDGFDQIHKVRRSDGTRFMQTVVPPIVFGLVGLILLIVGVARLV
jgi:hypothetical protein